MKEKWLSLLLVSALVVIALGISPVPASAAVTVAAWNFDGQNTTPSSGSGTINRGSGLLAPSPEYPQGNPSSGYAWSHRGFTVGATGPVSDEYIQIQVDLTNYAGITLSFDEQRSDTGPTNYEIWYSTDGATFNSTGASGTTSTNFATTPMHSHGFPYDSTVDQAIRGRSTVYFRIYAWGASHSAGTLRLDNVQITSYNRPNAIALRTLTAGVPASPLATLPVPGLVALGGLATVAALGIGAGRVRRRRE